MTRVDLRRVLVAGTHTLTAAMLASALAASCSAKHAQPNDASARAGAGGRAAARGDAAAGRTGSGMDAGRARDGGSAGSAARDAGSATTPKDAATAKDAAAAPDAAASKRDAATQGAHSAGGGKLCPELGWCELKDTSLKSVCPDATSFAEIQANEGCGGVINDWCGGIGDEKRNRLLIWGGGHRGYFGNEVYALDLTKLTMLRLNDPSGLSGIDLNQCTSPEAYADGRPSSRHTYDGLVYLGGDDEMFSVAGAGIPCGYAVTGTWTLDLATVDTTPLGSAAPWTNMAPDPHPTKASYGVIADYDPNSKRIVLDDTYNLWAYDRKANAYTLLNDSDKTNAHIDYHMTGRVDPKRKLFVAVGGGGDPSGGIKVFDIAPSSSYAQQDWTSQVSGCDALLHATSPGLAYDPTQDRMIGWAGGDTIYVLDLDAKSCTQVDYGGGPASNENGTFGRFRYFPALKVFAVVNDPGKNAFTLRLQP